jgi:hypothetical protein
MKRFADGSPQMTADDNLVKINVTIEQNQDGRWDLVARWAGKYTSRFDQSATREEAE